MEAGDKLSSYTILKITHPIKNEDNKNWRAGVVGQADKATPLQVAAFLRVRVRVLAQLYRKWPKCLCSYRPSGWPGKLETSVFISFYLCVCVCVLLCLANKHIDIFKKQKMKRLMKTIQSINANNETSKILELSGLLQ